VCERPNLSIISDFGSVIGDGIYDSGSTAFFSVSPTTILNGSGIRHIFTGWNSNSPGGYTGPDNPAEVVIDNNITQVAQWKTQYYITIEDSAGGSVTLSSGWYDAGSKVAISAIPNSGFRLSSWIGSGLGSYSGSKSSFTVILNGSITVRPVFLDIVDPIADAGFDKKGKVGEIIEFNALKSIDNVGIVYYEWDFGDGFTGSFLATTHVYQVPGVYTVTLTVKDRVGNSDQDTVLVTIEDRPETFEEKWGFPIWVLYLIGLGVVMSVLIFLLVKYS
jgi:hypothetical protein